MVPPLAISDSGVMIHVVDPLAAGEVAPHTPTVCAVFASLAGRALCGGGNSKNLRELGETTKTNTTARLIT